MILEYLKELRKYGKRHFTLKEAANALAASQDSIQSEFKKCTFYYLYFTLIVKYTF